MTRRSTHVLALCVALLLVTASCSSPAAETTVISDPSPSPAASSAPPKAPEPDPIDVLGYALDEFVDTSALDLEGPCNSRAVKEGTPVTITSDRVDVDLTTELYAGEVGELGCAFFFGFWEVPGGGGTYWIQVGDYPALNAIESDLTEEVEIWLPAVRTKVELALLKDHGIDADHEDADYIISSAHETCDRLAEYSGEALVGYLVEEEHIHQNNENVDVELAVKHLCAEKAKAIPKAKKSISDGNYQVGDQGGPLDIVAPGTYRTLTGVANCYWERQTAGGDIIDNDFVTSAPGSVHVTIHDSDGGFTSSGCGTWLPAG